MTDNTQKPHIVDSGATDHMSPGSAQQMTDYKPQVDYISLANDSYKVKSFGRGDLGMLKDVMHAPDMSQSLMSVSTLDLEGMGAFFGAGRCLIVDAATKASVLQLISAQQTSSIVMSATMRSRLYHVDRVVAPAANSPSPTRAPRQQTQQQAQQQQVQQQQHQQLDSKAQKRKREQEHEQEQSAEPQRLFQKRRKESKQGPSDSRLRLKQACDNLTECDRELELIRRQRQDFFFNAFPQDIYRGGGRAAKNDLDERHKEAVRWRNELQLEKRSEMKALWSSVSLCSAPHPLYSHLYSRANLHPLSLSLSSHRLTAAWARLLTDA
jgi:hypothetical protein